MSESFFNDKENALIVQTPFGADLNYAPFSTLYADVMEQLEDSSEINEDYYMRTLVKLGIIERTNGKVRPPLAIYNQMHGEDQPVKYSFYCKKESIIAKTYTENFGVCLDNIAEFRSQYNQKIINMLNGLNESIVQERAEADEWEDTQRDIKGRGNFGSIRKKANAMFTSGRSSVVESFFRG